MKSRKKKWKIQREWFGKKKEMEEQKSYGVTKIMWIETKTNIYIYIYISK
jgi:hypothetical protein